MKKHTKPLAGLPSEHMDKADQLFREAQRLHKLNGCASAIEAAQTMASASQEANWGWGATAPIAKAIQKEANSFRSFAVKKCGCG